MSAVLERHFIRRRPRKCYGFTWARFPDERGRTVTYRLFRRAGESLATHMQAQTFLINEDRSSIACRINAMRHLLRDAVDEIELKALGLLP